MPNKSSIKRRDLSLDYLRGIVVFLMVLAHVIHFFHEESNATLRFWEGVGNTVCFVTFLFISGAVTYLAYLKDENKWNEKKKKIGFRVLYLLIGYYLIGFTGRLNQFTLPFDFQTWGKTALDILIFKDVPGFTEFIFPFLFITATLPLFRRLYYKITEGRLNVAIAAFFTYILATALFIIPIGEPFNYYKALLVGAEGIYRFPIIQYLPVFFVGLYWGRFLVDEPSQKKKEKLALLIGGTFAWTYAISKVLTIFINISFVNPLNRWPPSIGFISIGMAFAFFSLIVILTIQKNKLIDIINRFFVYVGQDAFDMFLSSTLIILIYNQIYGQRWENMWIVILIFSIVTLLSMLMSSLNRIQSASLFNHGTDIFTRDQRIFKKRYLALATLLCVVVFANLQIPVYSDVAGEMVQRPEIIITQNEVKEEDIYWWNNDYGYYRQFEMKNEHPLSSLFTGQIVTTEIDHSILVQTQKSLEDGSDMKIVFLNEQGEYEETNLLVTNPNTTTTQLSFETLSNVSPNKMTNRYFLYYGKNVTEAANEVELKTNRSAKNYSVIAKKEVLNAINTSVSRKWNLIENREDTSLIFSAKINNDEFYDTILNYRVLDTEIEGMMVLNDPANYSATIDVSKLNPGLYAIQAIAKSNTGGAESQISYFYVSYPAYIAWTIDWEGYSESESALNKITEFSDEFEIPLTHFFNPRIYVTEDVTQEQRNFMTQWVLDRKLNHDDSVGLHLHMHKDFVEAAEVEVRNEPRWATFQENDGYDIPTTEYEYEEIMKMVKLGIELFEENGLGTPDMYRAGGWFADSDVMKVLEDLNFKLDSSGRKPELWWSKYSYWNLESTTQPYQPAKTNQNLSVGATYDFWEFPNNGGDTTGYESEALINKYKENTPKMPLGEKILVTYISHPKWIYTDAPKIEAVLNYLENFRNEKDLGPVKFITLEEAYNIWTQ